MDNVEQVARELEELLTDARQLGYMYDTSVSFSTLDRAIAALRERAGAVPDGVRHLVGKLDQWRPCMSYNDSYFGEPAGLVKAVSEELARAVDPIYPPKPEPVDPLAGVTIRTATVPLSPLPSPPVEQAARGGVDGWKPASVEPPHDQKKGSLGTEYLIHPPSIGGLRTAFYAADSAVQLAGIATAPLFTAWITGKNFQLIHLPESAMDKQIPAAIVATAAEAYVRNGRGGGSCSHSAMRAALEAVADALTAAQPQLEGGGDVMGYIVHSADELTRFEATQEAICLGLGRHAVYAAPPSAPVTVDPWANVPKEYVGLWHHDYDEIRRVYMVLASNRSSIAETEDPEVADAICRVHNCALAQQPARQEPSDG